MSRKIKISAGQLNIRLHPHSAELYIEYLRAIFREKSVAQVYGDRYGMISLLDSSQRDAGYISGVITTFVKIETDGTWFNSDSLREATEDQVAKVVLPDNLNPNAATFYFDFDIRRHRLYFQEYSGGKRLTPNSALRLWSGFSRNAKVMQEFGEAKISVVQSRSGLENVFNIPQIKRIEITILRPNPDIFAMGFEADIEGHLAGTQSRSMKIIYDAEVGGSIQPDDDIQMVSNAALTNGRVDVDGRDENGVIHRSTENYPLVKQGKFDPEEVSERNAFYSLARGADDQEA